MRFLLVLALTMLPAAVQAEDAKERAATLAERAVALGRSGDYVEALALFEQAYALSPEPVLLYNIGRVAEKLGDYKKAAGALRAFLEVEKDADKRAKAQDTLDAVSAYLPAYVTVSCSVAGAVVEIDGKPVGRTPLQGPLEVKPGKHRVKILALGKRPFEQAVELNGTESVQVSTMLEDESATVVLAIEPTAARVAVDGKPVVPGEHDALVVLPGAHTLRVETEGYEVSEQRFEVAAGEKKTLKVGLVKNKVVPAAAPATVLVKPPAAAQPVTPARVDVPSQSVTKKQDTGSPWYRKWWVWTAAGAVVAGSVTAAVLLTRGGSGRPAGEANWVVQ